MSLGGPYFCPLKALISCYILLTFATPTGWRLAALPGRHRTNGRRHRKAADRVQTQNHQEMQTIAELAREYPGVSITIQAADLLAFGEKLVADSMAAARGAEAARIKAAEAEDLITAAQAQELFGVSAPTLWRWRKRGYLEGVPVGGRIKYHKADCRRILAREGA